MCSSSLLSVFRHSLAGRAFTRRSPPSRLFSSTKLSQHKPQDALVKRKPLFSYRDDFAHLVESGVFIDKSTAIQDFLGYGMDSPVHLILRPRRSGKTTLLSMFRNFFERASPDERARRKDLFIKNNLAVTKDAQFEEEFGQYPVLYMDFKDVIGSTLAELQQNFMVCATETAQSLEDSGFFQNRGELPKNQLEFLEAILKGTVPDFKLPLVLVQLTKILHVLHRKKVVVLIDEYDTPTSQAVQNGYFPAANVFLRLVFSRLLKSNNHIRGALLVGILRAAESGWLSGVDNTSVFSLGQSSEYSTACMFTEDETRALYDRQVESKELAFDFNDLNQWYNGYSTVDGTKLFNPWSIANALTTGKLTTWWRKSGYDAAIQARLIELLGSDYGFRAQCQTLLDGGEIVIEIRDVDYVLASNMSRAQLWALMYYAGYLTTSHGFPMQFGARSGTPIPSNGRIALRIPNGEVQSMFRGWILEDFQSRMTPQLSDSSIAQFNLMANGHFAEFAQSSGNFFFSQAPSRIFGGCKSAYQEYVYAYFYSAARAPGMSPKWTIKREVGAGLGANIVFYRDVGVVVGVKRFAQGQKEGYRNQDRQLLTTGTKEALLECDTRHYRSMMPEHVDTIYEYGLAFFGPYCGVEARVLKKTNGTWIVDSAYTADDDEKRRQHTYCTILSDGSTTSKKDRGSRKRDRLMVATDSITGRNLYAKFYLKTHAPTVAEFAHIWNGLDHETVETWKTKARQMKKKKNAQGIC